MNRKLLLVVAVAMACVGSALAHPLATQGPQRAVGSQSTEVPNVFQHQNFEDVPQEMRLPEAERRYMEIVRHWQPSHQWRFVKCLRPKNTSSSEPLQGANDPQAQQSAQGSQSVKTNESSEELFDAMDPKDAAREIQNSLPEVARRFRELFRSLSPFAQKLTFDSLGPCNNLPSWLRPAKCPDQRISEAAERLDPMEMRTIEAMRSC